MLYAMMSIGVLGFVVWSQWLAFPIGDYEVINSTVGWNGLLFLFLFKGEGACTSTSISKLGNLLDTFYSLNASKIAQSAGNFLKGSSETIRGSTYELFKENYSYYIKQSFNENDCWLSWFVGFVEGDGAILEHKGRCQFVVTQKHEMVLHEIKRVLNIGTVKHFYDNDGNKKYSRFIVSDNKSIFLLYLLFNGNLVLESRVKQLSKWYVALNNASRFDNELCSLSRFTLISIPVLLVETKQPSLNDGWLSGFTDAEGCFSVKIANEKKKFYVSALFILDQKKEEKALNKIAFLFSPNLKAKARSANLLASGLKNNNTVYRLSAWCNHPNKIIANKILNYFNYYKLKTTKLNSFYIWKEILEIILDKQPLSNLELHKVRKLRHNMNYYTIENKTTGHANKS